MRFFWSYAKIDNKKPHKLSKLREAFNISLDQTVGFENKIVIDDCDLTWGVKWKKEIERLIQESDALIAVVSPSYFNRRMCIYELNLAIRGNRTILPILYRDCPKGLQSDFKTEGNEENVRLNKISKKVVDFQYEDFRKHRNKDVESEVVQNFLDKMSKSIFSLVRPA